MEKILLKAVLREGLGKSLCKQIREKGAIPGVVYKGGDKGINVQVDSKELWKALHTEAGENAIITMDIGGGKKNAEKTVMIKEVQQNPVNDKFVHVDFQEISLSEKLKVKVPVAVKGEAPGVKEDGGVFNLVLWEIEVECLPTAIPEHIDVHVENMRINDTIHVKDLPKSEGVEFVEDPEHTVVSVTPPKAEEGVAPAEAVVEGVEEPEVIKKGKKEEEGEAEEGGAAAPEKEKEEKKEKKEKKA
jgi:large subunit ribosomal protein L25